MKKTKLMGLLMTLAMLASMLMVPAYATEVNTEEPAEAVVEQTDAAAPAEGEDAAAPAEGEDVAASDEAASAEDEEAAAEDEAPKKNPIMSIVLVVGVIAVFVIAWTYNKRDNKKKITYG